jgi:L-asparaginase
MPTIRSREGMSGMRKLVLFTTGGTIEKSFDPCSGKLGNFEDKVKRCVDGLRFPWLNIEVVPALRKDSLDITHDDRQLLLALVRARSKEDIPIVISHGTDTIVATGRYLQESEPEFGCPIVLTGAMIPLGFDHSDGLQNIVQSITAAQLLAPGVYLAMHGEVYPVACVEKLPEQATFRWACQHRGHRFGPQC